MFMKNTVYVVESVAYGVEFTSCLCENPNDSVRSYYIAARKMPQRHPGQSSTPRVHDYFDTARVKQARHPFIARELTN